MKLNVNYYVEKIKTGHSGLQYNIMEKCNSCERCNKTRCNECEDKYNIIIWENSYVYKELIVQNLSLEELNKLREHYDLIKKYGFRVDFYNIYIGIDNAIINYIDNFGPQPEFILTNKKIKNKKHLNDIINKYIEEYKGKCDDKYHLQTCIDIIQNLYENKRIIYTHLPEEDAEIKFIKTKNEFVKSFKLKESRQWRYIKRSINRVIRDMIY